MNVTGIYFLCPNVIKYEDMTFLGLQKEAYKSFKCSHYHLFRRFFNQQQYLVNVVDKAQRGKLTYDFVI